MYLNASILQEIYQIWLDNMVWCLYLFHDYFILSCNIQLSLSLTLTQLSGL